MVYPAKIAELALKVREFAEHKRGRYGWPADLGGACASTSYLLARLYQQSKFRARIVVGLLEYKVRTKPVMREELRPDDSEHAWVELEGPIIVDVTATQFRGPYPKVLVTSPGRSFWDDYIPLAYSQSAIKTVLGNWGWQRNHLTNLKNDWDKRHQKSDDKDSLILHL